jgi:hypothetical protein
LVTTLIAVYDLQVGPASFDIVPFLAQAAIEQRKIGAERMHVCLVGEMRRKPQYDEHEARWRLMNICVPACALFGATFSLCADWLQVERIASAKDWKQWPPDWRKQTLSKRWHLVGGLIDRANAGEQIAKPTASEHALRAVRKIAAGRKFVTMTMRQTYLTERNSDGDSWGDAARAIVKRGYSVQTIRDTSIALREGYGFAELSLDLRMAWYQTASYNVVANCGPASLLWLSDRPYVMMGAGHPAEEWDGLFVQQGLSLGSNWPWALPSQTISYGKEVSETILAEFERWESATS